MNEALSSRQVVVLIRGVSEWSASALGECGKQLDISDSEISQSYFLHRNAFSGTGYNTVPGGWENNACIGVGKGIEVLLGVQR